MKRIIIIVASLIIGIIAFSACASSGKCPAYGHYSYVAPTAEVDQSL